MSIRRKVLIPMIIITVACSVTAYILSMYLFNRNMHEVSLSKVDIASNSANRRIEAYVQPAHLAAAVISGDAGLVDALKSNNRETVLSAAYDVLKKATDMDFCTILDSKGTVLARTHEPDNYGDSLAYQHSIQASMAGETETVIERGTVVRLSVRSAAPVYDENAEIIGIVSLGFRIDTQEFVSSLKSLTECEVTIYHNRESIVTTVRDKNGLYALNQADDIGDILDSVLTGQTYTGERDLFGRQIIERYIPIIGVDGEIVGAICVGDYWRESTQERNTFLVTGLSVTLMFLFIAVGVSLFISDFIDKRLNRLVDAIRIAGKNNEMLLESLDTMIVITTVETDEIVFVNEKMKEMLNLSSGIIGDKCYLHFNKDINERCGHCPKRDSKVYTGEPYIWEYHNPYVNRDHRITGRVIDWPDGSKVFFEQVDDITDMKTAIAETQHAKETQNSLTILGNILDSINAQIYASEIETGELLFVNEKMKEIFKKTDDELIGKHCYNVFAGLDHKCDHCPCYELDKYPDKTVVWDRYEETIGKYILHSDCYIDWPGGKKVHIQHAVDITDRMEAEHEVAKKNKQLEIALHNEEAANKAKSAFLANMSHEIRTPMNAILGITEIQLRDENLPPELSESLMKIYDSGNLLLNIINDILDLSKIEAGKLEITRVKYDFPTLINDTIQLNKLRYENKPIKMLLDIDDNVPRAMYGDELRIKQVLSNILSNAFKYTDEGEVKLAVSVSSDLGRARNKRSRKGKLLYNTMVTFRISDTGQGMSPEQIGMLFDEYSRFNLEANRTTVGTGLGMSITKHLVTLMNGNISVESVLDKGTTITVEIPQRSIGDEVCSADVIESLREFRFSSLTVSKMSRMIREYMPYGRVLVVDDVETNIYVARGMLYPYGLQIDTASSGYEAIDKIKEGNTYDIIFMDHMMPKMDGIETVEKLRDMRYKGTIIALTANALVGHAEMFMKNGFDGYISKPIDSRELNQILNEFIRDKNNS